MVDLVQIALAPASVGQTDGDRRDFRDVRPARVRCVPHQYVGIGQVRFVLGGRREVAVV